MNRQVRDTTMLGVILAALAIIIGLGFGLFGLSKSKASEGIVKNQDAVSEFQSIELNQFNSSVVMGRDISYLHRQKEGSSFAILVHTKRMEVGKPISLKDDRAVIFCNDIAYVNYGALLTNKNEDNNKYVQVKANESINSMENSLSYQDGVISTNGSFCLDSNGIILNDNTVGSWKKKETVEYIDENSKFDANWIVDDVGEVIGVCFTQL